jgi:hypothetical protein
VDPNPFVSCPPTSGATFALGRTTVHCTAKDASGNVARGSFDVTVADTTAPVLHVPRAITANASSPEGATVAYTATATDVVDRSPAVSCRPASGTTFAIGTTTVLCTATDGGGNSARASFTVHVKSAVEGSRDLRRHVTGAGRGKRLADKVSAIQTKLARGNLTDACRALKAFRSEVRAQSGGSLTHTKAAALLAEAARISATLGC